MVFGPGTQLVVHVDEEVADFDADDDLLNHQNKSTGTAPLDKLHHGQHCVRILFGF